MRGGYPHAASVAPVPQRLELSAVLRRGPQVEDVVDMERADLREGAALLAESSEALPQPIRHARTLRPKVSLLRGIRPEIGQALATRPVPGEPEPPVRDGGLVRRGARAPSLLLAVARAVGAQSPETWRLLIFSSIQ